MKTSMPPAPRSLKKSSGKGTQRSSARATGIRSAAEQKTSLNLRLKHILVPIDFSSTSRKALKYAVPLAKVFGAKITLIHVVEFPGYTGDPGYVGFDLTMTQRELNVRLKEFGDRRIPREIKCATRVACGVGFDAITEVAREVGADLIVITTHGHTGLKHVLLGSTAERVVRHAGCPVLVVR